LLRGRTRIHTLIDSDTVPLVDIIFIKLAVIVESRNPSAAQVPLIFRKRSLTNG
jgi:hypothetical protein